MADEEYTLEQAASIDAGRREIPPPRPEGLRRYEQLLLRGATLGFAGRGDPAEGLTENITEMVGQTLPIAGISAVASPVVGAGMRAVGAGAALGPTLTPYVARGLTAAATGAVVGGSQAVSEGQPVLPAAVKTGAQFAGLEGAFLGGAKLLGRALKTPPTGKILETSPIENPQAAEIARGQGVPPEYPVNLNLPVVRSSGVFDAKDYIGGATLNPERNPQLRQGRVLRPAEVTRAMLPSAERLALPPGPGQEEILALRQGAVSRGGAHFALPGESTYFDPENPNAVAYNLTGSRIADTENPGITKSIIQEALQQKRLTKAQRSRLEGLFREDNPMITYRENEELPITQAAKRLGYDGIKVWENDDVTKPSTVFLWNTRQARRLPGEASPYFTQVEDPKMGEVLVPRTKELENAATMASRVDPHTQGEIPLTDGQIYHIEERQPELKQQLDTETKRMASTTDELLKQPPEVVEQATQRGTAPVVEAHSIELTPAGLEARELILRNNVPEEEYVKFGSTLRGSRDEKMRALLNWLQEKCR